MTIIALIPARGGSKRVRRKNIALCAGKPLLEWTAAAAHASRSVDRVILSTDDVEVAAFGKRAGLEVPFMRPDNISNDSAPMLPVLGHVLDWAEDAGEDVEALVLLQPTSPLRTADHIDDAVALFRSHNAESVVSVVEVPHRFRPTKLLQMTISGGLESYMSDRDANNKSQADEGRYYGRNGPAVLVVRPGVIRSGKLYGEPTLPLVMAAEDSVDIDDPFDLWLADARLRYRYSAIGESQE